MSVDTWDAEEIWHRIMESVGDPITLKGGKVITIERQSDRVVQVVGKIVPPITSALVDASLKVWPTPTVSALPDQGNSSYVWALLRHVTGVAGSSAPHKILEDIRRLAAERGRLDREIEAAIRQAAAGDLSLRQIGDAAGVSHQTVARIVGGGS